MKGMAAMGGLMLLLAGCYPAQQTFDQNSTAYNNQATGVVPQPGTLPSWQRYDGTPVWPSSATSASASTPLFNNGPLSPYSNAVPRTTASGPAGAVVGGAMAAAAPDSSLLPAARGASPQPTPPALLMARAEPLVADMPIPKATAKSGPVKLVATPPLLAPLPESTPLMKEVSAPPRKEDLVNNLATAPIRPVSWEQPHVSAKMTASRSTPAVRMVNTKRIQLNYKVEDTGPSGVGSIELWSTADGRTWRKCEQLTQVASSCVTEVADEGIYGFTLVARSGNGNAKEPPKAGDLPQVWVEVDLTPPTVMLTEVKPAAIHGASHLHICWTASDRNLARRPITLSYTQNLTGPWTIIGSNLENTGRYDWSVPVGLAAKIYLKVEATDFVGNVGSAQTKEAVALDTAKPSVSILDVEPAVK